MTAGVVVLGLVAGVVLVTVTSTRSQADDRRTQLFDYASQLDPAGTGAVLTATNYTGSSTCLPLLGCEKQQIWLTYSTTSASDGDVCTLAQTIVEASFGPVRQYSPLPCDWGVLLPATGDDVHVAASGSGPGASNDGAFAFIITLKSGID